MRLASTLALPAAATWPVFALDPESPTSSYRRTTLTTEDGPGANISNDILQARDGFLRTPNRHVDKLRQHMDLGHWDTRVRRFSRRCLP